MKKKLLVVLCCTFVSSVLAQPVSDNHPHRAWYVSWGYNLDFWSNSDIHVSQPGLNNQFTAYDVRAGDDPEWTSGIFNKNLFSGQYNIRIGHFLNQAETWAVELNFDHTKYNSDLNQNARIAGVVNGQGTDAYQAFTSSYFNYKLHNGANELMLNIVRSNTLIEFPKIKSEITGIAKLGAGVLLPHPDNTIFGNKVDVGPKASGNYFGWRNGWWQMGGWVTGVEAGFQFVIHRRVYLELTDKEAYNSFSDIQVYQGRASQAVWLNEVIGNLGVMF